MLIQKKRLGSGVEDAQKIKEHEFFKGIEWERYWNKEFDAPFLPELSDEMDLRYFDKMFTDEPIDSNRPTVYSRPRDHSIYKGFTYVTNSVQKNIMKTDTLDENTIQEETAKQNDVQIDVKD